MRAGTQPKKVRTVVREFIAYVQLEVYLRNQSDKENRTSRPQFRFML